MNLFVEERHPEAKRSIVLLHAFPFSHAIWRRQLETLPSDWRILACDLRGFGKSPIGSSQFTMESMVDDLRELLDAKKIERAVLCGLSIGGYIALRAVEKYPERIGGLALCDTKSQADDNAGKLKRAASIQKVQEEGMAAFVDTAVPALLAKSSLEEQPDLVRSLKEIALAQGPEAICGAQLAMLSRTDTSAALSGIRCPSIVIHGEADPTIPIELARAMHEAIPGSKFSAIPKAGHISNLENPEAFNRALLSFLDTL